MYFVVFTTHRDEMGNERRLLLDAFAAYLHDSTHHPDVTVHHGGPTIGDDGESVNGLLLAVEAPSLEAVQTLVADSPYGHAGIFEQTYIRQWNWLTGRPG
ncbi:MAG: YciI family protein [Rhodospirillales bacterium]|nr:YciI family protein [Rhodospirillales bacterium]